MMPIHGQIIFDTSETNSNTALVEAHRRSRGRDYLFCSATGSGRSLTAFVDV